MRKRLIVIVVLLAVMKCGNESEEFSILELSILDFLTGHCVIVEKSSSAGASYLAWGTIIPKGECSHAARAGTYTTELSRAKALSDAYYEGMIAEAVNAGSACASLLSSLAAQRDAVTTATIATGAGNNPSGCLFLNRSFSYQYPGSYYCATQAAADNQIGTFRYLVAGNVFADMATVYERQKATARALTSFNGFSSAAIEALVPFGSAETALQTGIANATLFSNSDSNCARAILARNPALLNFLNRFQGDSSSSTLGTSGAGVSSVVVNPLNCGYGTDYVPTSTAPRCDVQYETY